MPRANKWFFSVSYSLTFVLGLAIGTSSMAGCGGSEDDNKTASNGGKKTAKKKKSSAKNRSKPSKSNTRVSVGRKEIDGIPYDVFYDDPSTIVQTEGNVSDKTTGNNTGGGGSGTAPTENTDTKPKTASTGTLWKEIIPKEILEAEIKKIRNKFTRYTQSVGNFNQNIFQIPPDAATLAMLAEIAIEHPDAVSWKDNAKYVRDLANKMVEEDVIRGRKSYDRVKGAFENIVDAMNGTVPPGMEKTEDKKLFSDVADFGFLMKRLERAESWTNTNVGNENAMKAEAEAALQEAYIIAAIAKVILTEGYGYADDDKDFVALALPMHEASLKMATAIKSSAFGAFDEGLNTVSQQCTKCHTIYKND